MSRRWDNSGNCESVRNKDHNVLVTSLWKEDGGRLTVDRRTPVWVILSMIVSQTRMLISPFKENAILWGTKRLKDNGNKAKNKESNDAFDNSNREHTATKRLTERTMIMASHSSSDAASCPMKFNNLNSVLHVAGQILLRIHAPEIKCQRTSGDECAAATCPWNMSGQHVPSVCTQHFFVPATFCNSMFLKHALATCPLSVHVTRFCPCYILQQHVPATWPVVWAHLIPPWRNSSQVHFVPIDTTLKTNCDKHPPFHLIFPGRNCMVNALSTLILQK